MAWVKGSELRVGDVINEDTMVGLYHHPYLVIATGIDRIAMRNCTSHPSSSFETIEIPDDDKSGNQKWKNGKSSYLVTDGDTMVIPVIVVSRQVLNESYSVPSGPPVTQQFENPDGSMSFRNFQPMMVVTRPRIVFVHSELEFYRIGKVSESWMTANT